MRLSEIIDNKLQVEALLYESGGEITPEIEEALALTEGVLEEKVDGYFAIIRKMEYGASEIDAEISRLQALKKTKGNAVRNLKRRLLEELERGGIRQVNGAMCKVFVQKNAPSVSLESEELVWGEYNERLQEFVNSLPSYLSVKADINKIELKLALQDGKEVEGAVMEQTKRVVFK